jgi:23S rRNA (adenine2030-N6)-methyltransferase
MSAGLLIVNPPWTLADELQAVLHELEKPLGWAARAVSG